MPDAINCSFSDPGAPNECTGSYKTTLDAVEAAGIAVVWSAGNTGPGTSTIRKPKNINTNEVNIMCVGAIDGVSFSGGNNSPIASFSSRGPSDCGGTGSLNIKPEVVAPGVDICSAWLSSIYAIGNGTSWSAPHVTGAIGLLKQAFPNLTGEQIKLAIYNTAIDLGSTGEDNDYGKGLIDVYAAFLSLASIFGLPTQIGNDLVLQNQTINGQEFFLACTIAAGAPSPNGFNISSTGNVTMIAAKEIIFVGDVEIFGELDAFITPFNCEDCPPLLQFRISSKDSSKNDIKTSDVISTKIHNKNFQIGIYPNPLRNFTNIYYILTENTPVKLSISNLYGQVVKELINEYNQPKGNYQIRFDASNLIPGLYFCTITTKDYTASHKFSVIK